MERKNIFKELVGEAIVLLKNEECTLPLRKHQKVAFFGRTQAETFFSGNGSGASKALKEKNLIRECEKNGIWFVPELKHFYEEQQSDKSSKFAIDGVDITGNDALTCGFMYEIFGQYVKQNEEYRVPEELVKDAGKVADIAILALGRNCGGEECDRHLENDYYLLNSEKQLIQQVCSTFESVVLILNVNGLIDLGWIKNYPMIKSILFIGIPGEDGCGAMADILTGKINPSGKLSVSIAERYEDYPSAEYFTWNKNEPDQVCTYERYGLSAEENRSIGYEKSPVTLYYEDIYMGYRYFDTFHKKVLFPFGHGLSYTEFEIQLQRFVYDRDEIEISVLVVNTGCRAGKETVQVYISALETATERPYQELKGFEKSPLLQPGEQTELNIRIPFRELACYSEKRAAYVVEKGKYQFRIGTSSRQTQDAGEIDITQDVITQHCSNRLQIQECNREKLKFLSQNPNGRTVQQEIKVSKDNQEKYDTDARVKTLSERELAALCVGYGPGTPFSAFGDGTDPETIFDEEGKPLTTNSHSIGTNGYVSPAIKEKGIYSIFYKDGPAGVGAGAWPTEMLIACAFNKELWKCFGDKVGTLCEKKQVDVWLAPAVNLHRHPLCGRNFEYFSEDPYLTGMCAVQIAKGVQEKHKVCVCPKHFAVNEQESFRRGSAKKNYDAVDSILTERAVRELYLKPFEMLVKEGGISFLMTSFNKINGTFAGGSKDLCTHILRDEWGYKGVVVTDWGDMDMVVDGGDALAAGNDIIMPGGPPVIKQILEAYERGKIGRKELERSVSRLIRNLDYFAK